MKFWKVSLLLWAFRLVLAIFPVFFSWAVIDHMIHIFAALSLNKIVWFQLFQWLKQITLFGLVEFIILWVQNVTNLNLFFRRRRPIKLRLSSRLVFVVTKCVKIRLTKRQVRTTCACFWRLNESKMHGCVFHRCGLCKTITFEMENVIDIDIVDVFFSAQECHLNVY